MFNSLHVSTEHRLPLAPFFCGESWLHSFFMAPMLHTYTPIFIFKRFAGALLPSTSRTPTNHALCAFNLQYNVLKGTREASLATLITLEHSPISRPSFNTPHPLQNIFQKSSHNVIILLIRQAVRKSGSRQFKPSSPHFWRSMPSKSRVPPEIWL